ncbi:hexokinase-3 isoform X1 [Ornithorhynchus anatinus]|uniref:hexokinase-3 isoform X1 n=1 Tax=Ornithorhynchus anatinus TaxID=9258 RepID=UPI0010A7E620|nr:hexokinase-3 isoform X1 [Ornithorhynchus anatinus]
MSVPQSEVLQNGVPELVQECLQVYDLSEEQLRVIQARILKDMEHGLSQGQTKSTSSIQMLPTYVRSTPHGTEKGDFLVLELGGTDATLRVLWVTLTGDAHRKVEPKSQVFSIPSDVMLGSGLQLFDFVAKCLTNFLDQQQVRGDKQPIKLGFSFSFPCHQTGLDRSTLISWTKGFKCSDVEGKDVVQLLRDAIKRQEQKYRIDVVAVVNDTVGTMMSCGSEELPCEIGLIVDTGTNSCYMEEARHVAGLEEEQEGGKVCVNTQWGSFGDDGSLKQTSFDVQLDRFSLNPGKQRFEKMVSGMYLGELVRLTLVHLAEKGALFGGNISEALEQRDAILIQHVVKMEDPSAGPAQTLVLLKKLGLAASEQDCKLAQQVCKAVSTRAARLCAAALAATLNRLQTNRELPQLHVAVATGGAVYQQHPSFSRILQETVKALVPACDVSFVPSEDGGGRGVAVVTAVASRQAKHRRLLAETLAPLRLEGHHLQELQAQMQKAMERGLRGEPSSLRMLPTFVRATPDGSERGDFLALDLGGTNFRVLLVQLRARTESGISITNEVYSLPENVIQGTGEQLFDHIVNCIVDFQKKNGLAGRVLPLGFTFSFPCQQLGLDQGILLSWTKGFNASDCEGKDVVTLLRQAIARRKDVQLNVVAIVNDTVGTMMSCAYDDLRCEVGLIVGTGTNACYMEEMKHVVTVPGEEGRMCINMEWGAFGDDGGLEHLITDFDRMVDKNSINPGKQKFEKLISGMFLGEIVRSILLHLTEREVLFRGRQIDRLQTKDIFKTKFLSDIERDSLALRQVRAILLDLGLQLTCDDALVVREVCQTVSRRAAQLCGAGVAAVVEKIRQNRELDQLNITVGVDGTLYKLHPHFSRHVQEVVRELTPRCTVTFLQSEDGSGKGAALITAVACRIANQARP